MKLKLIIILLFAQFIDCKAQITKDSLSLIWLEYTISLDDSLRQNEEYLLTVINSATNEKLGLKCFSKSQLGLEYNKNYQLLFTGVNCNTKIIDVDTHAPKDKWLLLATVKLNTDSHDKIRAGKIFYSENEKTFTRSKN